MEKFFYPNSIVVIGVSSRFTNLGKEIARNLYEFNYTGETHYVGSHEGIIFGRRIHTNIEQIRTPIDLAVILTPARTVPDYFQQCAQKGIPRVIIETGGFGELGAEGRELGNKILSVAKAAGMRFVGPNCIGLMNSANGMATPFATMKNVFKKGDVGIIAQSGGVALSLLNMLDGEQIGFSKFAAIGNKLNVDENDLIEYLTEDAETKIICLYLESIQAGRRLMDIALKSDKPIVAHKANIGVLSQNIAQSHTDALVNDDQVVETAFKQAGIARFRDMQNYLDFVKILGTPRVQGRNLAIISRSGGHAVIATDAAYIYNFDLPAFSESFLNEIRKSLRADVIKLNNPLDLGDLFDFEVYVRIVEHTLKQPNIDAVLFLHTYFASVEGETSRTLLKNVAELSHKYQKAVLMCVSTEQFELSQLHKQFDYPIYLSPERAIAALDTSIKYYERRDIIQAERNCPFSATLKEESGISDILDAAKAENRSPHLAEAMEIVRAAGIETPSSVVSRKKILPAGVGELKGPLAIKLIASGISHKSDVGGVVLNIPGDRLQVAIDAMHNNFSSKSGFEGVFIQEMAPTENAFELIVGAKRDAQFGPVLMLGFGGIFVELLKKTVLRIAPVSHNEIERMVSELPGAELLAGARGVPPIDKTSLMIVIDKISQLMLKYESISSLDINPLIVSESGAVAVDARIFVN